MSVISTNTKIRANINDTGIDIFVYSPEISLILESGSFLSYVWKNREDIKKHTNGNEIVSFDAMVKYFAKHPKLRSSKDFGFFDSSCYNSLFTFLSRKFSKSLGEKAISIDSSNRWLISTNKNTVNLSCLINPKIKDGNTTSYTGVFSRKFVNEEILPTIRGYAAAFIKTFGNN